jgi:DNA mismatch endonuclease, patch repair protein
MSRVRSKNTPPEIKVRKVAHSLGLRFRIHCRDLPGSPDIVFPKYRVAIFVHGCFWHRHRACGRARMPKSNVRYWRAKFLRNVRRDREAIKHLKSIGWKAVTIWECQTRKNGKLITLIKRLFKQEKRLASLRGRTTRKCRGS